LDQVAEQQQLAHIADSTRSTYDAGVRSFTQFCASFNLSPFPADQQTLSRFIAALSSRGIAFSTIRVYLAGVANAHAETGMDCCIFSPAIQRQLTGIKRILPSQVARDQRQPITLALMQTIKTCLRLVSGLPSVDQIMLWSAFTMAFSGALRVSEFVSPSTSTVDSSRTLLPSDIKLHKDTVQITIRKSKTDQFGHGYILSLPATGRSVCPVSAYTKYWSTRRHNTLDGVPLFVFSDGRFLTRKAVDGILNLIPSSNHKYSSHSFRIGAATTAVTRGQTEEEVMQKGRWTSKAWEGYVRAKVPVAGLNPY
jgi:hypothetical protein